jgi:hypothetical protein
MFIVFGFVHVLAEIGQAFALYCWQHCENVASILPLVTYFLVQVAGTDI